MAQLQDLDHDDDQIASPSPASDHRTVLALRLDDPAGLFSLDPSLVPIDDLRRILKAHHATVYGARGGPDEIAGGPVAVVRPLVTTAEIGKANETELNKFVADWRFVAVFTSEAEGLHWAVAIQNRVAESLQRLDRPKSSANRGAGSLADNLSYHGGEARLQCAIVLAHAYPSSGLVGYVESRLPTRLRGATLPASPLEGEALNLLADPDLVAGGRIVCTGSVYQALLRTDAHLLYKWQEITKPAPPIFNRDYLWTQISRPFTAVDRFARGRAEPMECLYDDAQVLLNAPFERMFTEEIAGWIRPRNHDESRGLPSLPYPERPHPRNELVGLSLSGGGMRSAVFSLGAVQALAHAGLLQDVDYLSTVSGGGYFGAALSALCADPLPYDDLKHLDATPTHFPFASPRPPSDGGIRAVHGNESPALKHVRENAKLLGRGIGLFDANTWSRSGRMLVSMLLLWVLFLLPAATLIILGATGTRIGFETLRARVDWADPWWIAVASTPGIFAALSLALSARAWWTGDQGPWRARLRAASLGSAIVSGFLLVTAVFGSVTLQPDMAAVWHDHWLVTLAATSPLLLYAVSSVISVFAEGTGRAATYILAPIRSVMTSTALVLTLVLVLCVGVWAFDQLWNGTAGPYIAAGTGIWSGTLAGISLSKLWDAHLKENKRIQRLIWQIGLAVGGYVVLGLALAGWAWFLWSSSAGHPWPVFRFGTVGAGILTALTLYHPLSRGLLNHFSLNRLYAEMIQETWVVGAVPPSVSPNTKGAHWTEVWPRPDITVGALRKGTPAGEASGERRTHNDGRPSGPYHLVCTSLNIPGSTSAKLLDRQSDSFVISPIYSGSALTRWFRTDAHATLEAMPLAEAAAISGAVAAPNMGTHTTRTLSIMLTLLNVRLGRWIRNPRPSTNSPLKKMFADLPLVLYWKEMLGLASHEDGQIYLSDGGHFENLGLYELFRRRCKYIIAISADVGTLDEAFDMGNLGRALRLARVDFGVEAHLGPLSPLMHDPNTGQVQSFFAAGEFSYPNGGDNGILILIKTGIIEKQLPADLLGYWKNDHPAFPYDSTTDQQYDQPQFESYRQLGYIAADAMWRAGEPTTDNDGKTLPARLERICKSYARVANPPEPSPAN